MIVRTHVAFGGNEIVFVGVTKPWDFKKRSQAFSRRLEELCEMIFLPTDDAFFHWCGDKAYTPVALEISSESRPLRDYPFPARTALVVGNEGRGLPEDFMARCPHRVLIPQYGQAGCLNVAVSCSIALYEVSRASTNPQELEGSKFGVRDTAPAKG